MGQGGVGRVRPLPSASLVVAGRRGEPARPGSHWEVPTQPALLPRDAQSSKSGGHLPKGGREEGEWAGGWRYRGKPLPTPRAGLPGRSHRQSLNKKAILPHTVPASLQVTHRYTHV